MQSISKEGAKLNLARLKKFGLNFEISVDPETALRYKRGEISDLREVVLADNVFSDAKKGLIAKDGDLVKVFETSEFEQVAKKILEQGEVQLNAEHRSQEKEKRRRKLIGLICRQAVDPSNNLPHPPNRIEAALEEARVHLDDHHTIEEQFDEIISKLRPIIPLKIEQKQMQITIPGTYAGKMYQVVKDNCKILHEDWHSDGSWRIKVELPAGMQADFIEKLNSLTKGEVHVEVLE